MCVRKSVTDSQVACRATVVPLDIKARHRNIEVLSLSVIIMSVL